MIQFQENIASQSRVSQILELWRNKKQCQANWSINLPLSDFFPFVFVYNKKHLRSGLMCAVNQRNIYKIEYRHDNNINDPSRVPQFG